MASLFDDDENGDTTQLQFGREFSEVGDKKVEYLTNDAVYFLLSQSQKELTE